MFGNSKFPYFNMQQLNLDWLMDHIANMPEIVKLPALAGSYLQDVSDMIDAKALDIPKGICFIDCGMQDDPMDRRCACLLYKIDNDNLLCFTMSMAPNIAVNVLFKRAGVWS